MSKITTHALRALASVNANMFIALAALLETQSVTGAARVAGVTQPAMSQTLKQLRAFYNDPLLERAGNAMVLTPFAERLVPHLGDAIQSLARLMTMPDDFDPTIHPTTFKMTAREQFSLPIAASLTRHWAQTYPKLALRVVAYPGTAALPTALARRDIDVAIAVDPRFETSEIHRTLLFEESFVCLMRRGHPLDQPHGLSLEDYLAASHAIIATDDVAKSAIDTALNELGVTRRVVVRMASFLGAPLLCTSTDVLVACPARLAQFLSAQTHALSTHDLPIPSPRFSVWLATSAHRDDGELAFFRDAVVASVHQALLSV